MSTKQEEVTAAEQPVVTEQTEAVEAESAAPKPEGNTQAEPEKPKALVASANTPDGLAAAFAGSGYFKGVNRVSQAIVKMAIGRELGVGPAASMTDIHLIDGKPVLSGTLLAGAVRASDRYDYRVVTHTNDTCLIEFTKRDRETLGLWGKAQVCGTSEFTMDDARLAGLQAKDNWKKYPKAMLFARAMSQGVKWNCPDVFSGMGVYAEGDDFGPRHEDAEVFAAPPSFIEAVEVAQDQTVETVELTTDSGKAIVVEVETGEVVAPAPVAVDESGWAVDV